jgi:hypothetical protein
MTRQQKPNDHMVLADGAANRPLLSKGPFNASDQN